MSDSIFLDTNILVYSYSITEPGKQSISRKLISENNTIISTQVLQELANVLQKKFGKDWRDVQRVLDETAANNFLHTNDKATITNACRIAEAYSYSFYDSLIIAAALDTGCTLLYSEDMKNEHLIDGQLKIVNPFLDDKA